MPDGSKKGNLKMPQPKANMPKSVHKLPIVTKSGPIVSEVVRPRRTGKALHSFIHRWNAHQHIGFTAHPVTGEKLLLPRRSFRPSLPRGVVPFNIWIEYYESDIGPNQRGGTDRVLIAAKRVEDLEIVKMLEAEAIRLWKHPKPL